MKIFLNITFIILISALINFALVRGVWGGDELIYDSQLKSPGMPFESSHERAPYAHMLSILRNNSSVLSPEYAEFSSPDVGIYNGRLYSYFPPGISMWILPFYIFGQPYNLSQLFAYSSISIFAILSGVLLYLIGREIFRFPNSTALLIALVFEFSSTSLSYAVTIYQHSASTFLILLSFYSAWRFRKNEQWGFIWGFVIWLCYGISILVDYANAVLFLPILVYFALSSIKVYSLDKYYKVLLRPSLFLSFTLFLVISFGHITYNELTYGNWRIFSNLLPRYDINKVQSNESLVAYETNAILNKSSNALLAESNSVNGLYELLIAPDKGILIFSPIFIIALFGILYRTNNYTIEKATILGVITVNIMFYASFSDPYGGWAFGPRYLIPAMAFLSLFVGIWLNEYKRFSIIKRLIVFFLFTVSTSIAVLGAITTNSLPPKVEAIHLKINYGIPLAFEYLKQGKTGSFIFNNFFNNYMYIETYYFMIVISLAVVSLILLFLLPLFEREKYT